MEVTASLLTANRMTSGPRVDDIIRGELYKGCTENLGMFFLLRSLPWIPGSP